MGIAFNTAQRVRIPIGGQKHDPRAHSRQSALSGDSEPVRIIVLNIGNIIHTTSFPRASILSPVCFACSILFIIP